MSEKEVSIAALSIEEIDEITALSLQGKLLVADYGTDVSAIATFIDKLYHKELHIMTVDDLSFKLGAFYGQFVCEKYNWSWKIVTENNQSAYAVCTPDLGYGIQAFNYFYLFLTTKKESNVVLLFNMIATLEKRGQESDMLFLK